MGKSIIANLYLALTMGLCLFLGPQKGESRDMSDKSVGAKHYLKDSTIVEIIFKVDSPPFLKPNVMTFKPSEDGSYAEVISSGLKVSGQRGRKYTVSEPGTKRITKEQYTNLVDMIKDDDAWFIKKPEDASRPGSFHALYSLVVKYHSKKRKSGDTMTVKVESWYFEDNRPNDPFKALFKEVGEKFGIGEEFYSPHRYD